MLQFGTLLPGAVDRPAAFGVAERGSQIALVRIDTGNGEPWWDLPGGALDPGEDEAAAMIREFGEETGLNVRAGAEVARVAQ
jgi:8-oxo-dGTP diphosphatase